MTDEPEVAPKVARWHRSPFSGGVTRTGVQFFIMGIRDSEKDRLALSVADRHADFEAAFAANRGKYPIPEFRLFAEAVRNYVEKTRSDDMVHRAVAGAVHGLVDELTVERKRVRAKCSSRPTDWSASFSSA